jgi:hypothetical protein
MNALANEATVKGDFSGQGKISYRGGTGSFYREGGKYFMRLQRGAECRTYEIHQTIGSRFYQYYVGKMIEGPEPPEHHFYHKDHVLPFGYWLPEKEWVPIVHVGTEEPDAKRPDPFKPPDSGGHYAEYSVGCNYCHTTFPLADTFGRNPRLIGKYAPVSLHWSLQSYLENEHPRELPEVMERMAQRIEPMPMTDWEASHFAVTLGVSCEACHLGCQEHVTSGGQIKPRFFPSSPYLYLEDGKKPDSGRTHDNVNWACGRCHTGTRPQFAAGMSTWNSVEYSDAMRGSCYSQLRCIDCHNPHQAIGQKWSGTASQDDGRCLKCHQQFTAEQKLREHTHHAAGSEGSHCMNCHMPRLNEGIQDVVRTHMIYSPTRSDMIEANHPNACNICHTNKPIDWTLGYLKDWYGKSYSASKLSANYPQRGQSVAAGWLAGKNESVRLVAIAALARSQDPQAVPLLVAALNDPFLINRQFAAKELKEKQNVRPTDFGYHFYMTDDERRQPLLDLRKRFVDSKKP